MIYGTEVVSCDGYGGTCFQLQSCKATFYPVVAPQDYTSKEIPLPTSSSVMPLLPYLHHSLAPGP